MYIWDKNLQGNKTFENMCVSKVSHLSPPKNWKQASHIYTYATTFWLFKMTLTQTFFLLKIKHCYLNYFSFNSAHKKLTQKVCVLFQRTLHDLCTYCVCCVFCILQINRVLCVKNRLKIDYQIDNIVEPTKMKKSIQLKKKLFEKL